MNIIKGFSSLLFIFSFYKSLYGGEEFVWYKISHILLIIASFLCNASEFQPLYVQFDYASIFLISASHLNNSTINSGLILYIIYEYSNYRSIETAKNIAFGMSVANSMYKGYYCLDNAHFYTLMISSVAGVIIYKIRYDICIDKNEFSNNIVKIPELGMSSTELAHKRGQELAREIAQEFCMEKDNSIKIVLLTTMFHVCIMNILYVSCLTFGK